MATNDPEGIPPEYEERLALKFCIDTHIIDDASPAVDGLRGVHREGWINLQCTDTVDKELEDASDPVKRRQLLDASAGYVVSRGPAFSGHSRFDRAVFCTRDDDERHARAYRILWPESDRHDRSTNLARRKFRDAMHVATANRYGGRFITREKRILKKAPALMETLGIEIHSPEHALAFVQRQRANYEHRQRRSDGGK